MSPPCLRNGRTDSAASFPHRGSWGGSSSSAPHPPNAQPPDPRAGIFDACSICTTSAATGTLCASCPRPARGCLQIQALCCTAEAEEVKIYGKDGLPICQRPRCTSVLLEPYVELAPWVQRFVEQCAEDPLQPLMARHCCMFPGAAYWAHGAPAELTRLPT
ncbi:hypothetical protein OH77DRAFT_695835 [Trametes cingulata]|nr:hypothetical protein OH77DRAFT_695835 [Trametes cingulata]